VPDGPDGLGRGLLGGTIAGLVLFVAGLSIGVAALEIDRRDREQWRGALSAEGTVVAQVRQRRPEGTMYAPVIAFVTASGERVSFTARIAADDPSVYWIGARFPVRYWPEDPANARIDWKTWRRTRNAIGGVLSLALMSFGAYVAWYARRLATATGDQKITER
jgi:hypothetical protein